MLDAEYKDLDQLLADKRSSETCFFAFANTVATLNFRKDNEAHGWLGVKFQLKPRSEPNEVILHVKLFDGDTLLQQNALGILGINLIFACFYYYNTPNTFLKSLLDNVSSDRLEITMIRMGGKRIGIR